CFAVCKELGDTAIAAIERGQPVAYIEFCLSDCGGIGMAIFDEDLLPGIGFLIELIEPIEDDVLQPLAVCRRDVKAIKMLSDLAPVASLLDSEAGQRYSVGDVGLLELHETDECLQGVADNLLHHFGPCFGLEISKCDFCLSDNLRQEGEELAVPATTGSGCG